MNPLLAHTPHHILLCWIFKSCPKFYSIIVFKMILVFKDFLFYVLLLSTIIKIEIFTKYIKVLTQKYLYKFTYKIFSLCVMTEPLSVPAFPASNSQPLQLQGRTRQGWAWGRHRLHWPGWWRQGGSPWTPRVCSWRMQPLHQRQTEPHREHWSGSAR